MPQGGVDEVSWASALELPMVVCSAVSKRGQMWPLEGGESEG